MKRKKGLGLAFTDHLLEPKKSRKSYRNINSKSEWVDLLIPNYESSEEDSPLSAWRVVFASCVILVVFFGLFLRLFHLQITTGSENRALANSNRIQIRVIHAPRGVIYDRNGVVLADNNPGFRLNGKFITRDQALELEAKNATDYEKIEVDAIRSYPKGVIGSHMLGYVGEVSEDELKNPKYSSYKPGDRIGRSGLEQVYEQVLHGQDGAEIVEIDATGHKLRTLRKIDPVAGNNLHLSVDADLQKNIFDSLKEGIVAAKSCCGVAVAQNPTNGEILGMISWPTFDPNAFTDPKRNHEIAAYFQDQDAPLLNRVIEGTYPPGSTFKIVSALAGLSTKKIDKTTQFEDTGVMSLGPYTFANWFFTQHGQKEGLVDVVKALKRSNDIFFYQVGARVGVEEMAKTAKKIGFGKALGIDLPGEATGLIPSPEWKEKNVGELWYPGDNLHMAIGQGYVLTTPLQILAGTSFIADNGTLYTPHIVTKLTDGQGKLVKDFRFKPQAEDIFSKDDISTVQKGLMEVPKPGGTAWPFFNFTIPTAGKTGTAEFGDPKDRTHAWYTSYAPADDPQIALTVLVEAGGEGSSVAGPITKKIYTWYFNTDKNNIQSLDTTPLPVESVKLLGE